MNSVVDVLGIIKNGVVQSVTKPKQDIHFLGNPRSVYQNQVPWQVSLVTMVVGIGGVCLAHHLGIDLLEKTLLVVIGGAGGNLIGLSVAVKGIKIHDLYLGKKDK